MDKVLALLLAILMFAAATIMLPIGGVMFTAINTPYGWRKTVCVPADYPSSSHTRISSDLSYGVAYMREVTADGNITGPVVQLRTPPVFSGNLLFPRSQNDVNSWIASLTCENARRVCFVRDNLFTVDIVGENVLVTSGVTEHLSKVAPICLLFFGTLALVLFLVCLCCLKWGRESRQWPY